MDKYKLTVTLLICVLIQRDSHVVRGMSQYMQNSYWLMNYLFTDHNVDVYPKEDGDAIPVAIQAYLVSIQDLDEKKQELVSTMVFQIGWIDSYLTWNASDYGNITSFLSDQSKVWLPDVVVKNSVDSLKHLGYKGNKVTVHNTGEVNWWTSHVVITGCDIDVTYYPLDTQVCSISLGTWMSTSEDISLIDWTIDNEFLRSFGASGTWELVNYTASKEHIVDGTESIVFRLTLKRLRAFYLLNIILPVIFISLTASMVFMLPADAGEKMGMCITVLLAYAVYLTIIADNMPQTSRNVSYLAIYLTLLLGVTAFGVVISVFVLHLHHKPEEAVIGPRTMAVTRKIRRWLWLMRVDSSDARERVVPDRQEIEEAQLTKTAWSSNITNKSRSTVSPAPDGRESSQKLTHAGMEKEQEEEITWPKIAEAVDRVLFITSSVFNVVVTIAFFSILASGKR